jgi:hypothetical protein
MSGFVGDWIRSIAAAALIAGMAMALCPKGKVQRVLRAICGLLLIIAIMSPLTGKDSGSISIDLAEYRAKANEITAAAGEKDMNLSRGIIEREFEEYILDKASETGVFLESADVTMNWDENGYWYPCEVTLVGELSTGDRNRLSAVIESELGIPTDRQNWSGYEGD